jgi:nucleoside-diphosphate-sugar epimerase
MTWSWSVISPGAVPVRNLEWLKALSPLDFVKQDVQDARGIADVVVKHRDADVVLHLAGQVAAGGIPESDMYPTAGTRGAEFACADHA